MLLLSSADFFSKSTFSKNSFRSAICVKLFKLHIRTDILPVLIWVQTVCKGYQQTTKDVSKKETGAKWLSGRVLDSRTRGRGFKPHRRHCVVVLEQDTFILA